MKLSGAPATTHAAAQPQAPEGHEAQADDEVEDRVQRGEDPPRTLSGRFLLKQFENIAQGLGLL